MIRFIPLFAVALALAPVAASAQTSTSQTRCSYDNKGIYQCEYKYNGKKSTITTRCASGRHNTDCETEIKPNDPYPATRIDDGHGPR